MSNRQTWGLLAFENEIILENKVPLFHQHIQAVFLRCCIVHFEMAE